MQENEILTFFSRFLYFLVVEMWSSDVYIKESVYLNRKGGL